MKFVIDRRSWICGRPTGNNHRPFCSLGKGRTELLNADGFMCCLGHIAKQLKPEITDDELKYKSIPSYIEKLRDTILCSDRLTNTALTYDAVDINDDTLTTVSEKEEKLIELFAKAGHEVVFEN